MVLHTVEQIIEKLYAKSVVIVGAGNYGKTLGKYLLSSGINIIGFIDKKSDKAECLGKSIKPYSFADGKKEYLFLVSTIREQKSMVDDLHKYGVMDNQIVTIEGVSIIHEMMQSMDTELSEILANNRKLKNLYYGKRCFVIGNGPSLTTEDLDMLKDEFTIGCNSVNMLYNKTIWRPTVYCAQDTFFIESYMGNRKDIEAFSKSCDILFTTVNSPAYKLYKEKHNDKWFFFNPMGCWQNDVPMTELPRFSDNICNVIYTCVTIAYTMLQVAVYMGTKEIYLIGMDCTFSHEQRDDGKITVKNILNHPKDIESAEEKLVDTIKQVYGVPYLMNMDKLFMSYLSVKKYADEHNIKIYNATRGGTLEIFERVDFDSLF